MTCSNGGTCDSDESTGAFTACHCSFGYYGDYCENAYPCTSNPCLGRGSCINNQLQGNQYYFTCDCISPYIGHSCQYVDPCSTSLCHNEGTCSYRDGNLTPPIPTCTCTYEYFGALCENAYPCTLNPCQGRGSCTNDAPNNFTCDCYPPNIGLTCQYVNPCSSNLCQNNSPNCSYTDGMNTPPVQICTCSSGYYGESCENAYPCTSSPCRGRGICTNDLQDTPFNFTCACNPPHIGLTCQYDDPCLISNNACLNGGTCDYISGSSSPPVKTCLCQNGIYGDICENAYPCTSSPCRGRGICTNNLQDSPFNFTCACNPPHIGLTCQYDDPCLKSNKTCLNGGTCDYIGGSSSPPVKACLCPDGFSGDICENGTRMDLTTSAPAGIDTLSTRMDLTTSAPAGIDTLTIVVVVNSLLVVIIIIGSSVAISYCCGRRRRKRKEHEKEDSTDPAESKGKVIYGQYQRTILPRRENGYEDTLSPVPVVNIFDQRYHVTRRGLPEIPPIPLDLVEIDNEDIYKRYEKVGEEGNDDHGRDNGGYDSLELEDEKVNDGTKSERGYERVEVNDDHGHDNGGYDSLELEDEKVNDETKSERGYERVEVNDDHGHDNGGYDSLELESENSADADLNDVSGDGYEPVQDSALPKRHVYDPVHTPEPPKPHVYDPVHTPEPPRPHVYDPVHTPEPPKPHVYDPVHTPEPPRRHVYDPVHTPELPKPHVYDPVHTPELHKRHGYEKTIQETAFKGNNDCRMMVINETVESTC
ncbi:uncharacterized protein LOC105436828 isoform X2 [Strongylocentrotus purpuratus]|nr:uncharacterized protein LOC105436828 isoform X2 [Strongylocentrotus purpuratus]